MLTLVAGGAVLIAGLVLGRVWGDKTGYAAANGDWIQHSR